MRSEGSNAQPYFSIPSMLLIVITSLFLVVSCGGGGGGGSSDTTPATDPTPAPEPTPQPEPTPLPNECGDGCFSSALFLMENQNRNPVRIAEDDAQRLYVTDSWTNSIFIYENQRPAAELKDLDTPLGLAIDADGNIYVGNKGRRNIEVYDRAGTLLKVIDNGNIQLPNEIEIDQNGYIYVVDSFAKKIKVYSPTGAPYREIGAPGTGNGKFDFPVDLLIDYSDRAPNGELYVADQGQGMIQVFDLNGVFLRAYGSLLPFTESTQWQGRFSRLQSLEMDQSGWLHAVDSYASRIQILDPATGNYLDVYGDFGKQTGQLYVPLDIFITSQGHVWVANKGTHRLDLVKVM